MSIRTDSLSDIEQHLKAFQQETIRLTLDAIEFPGTSILHTFGSWNGMPNDQNCERIRDLRARLTAQCLAADQREEPER